MSKNRNFFTSVALILIVISVISALLPILFISTVSPSKFEYDFDNDYYLEATVFYPGQTLTIKDNPGTVIITGGEFILQRLNTEDNTKYLSSAEIRTNGEDLEIKYLLSNDGKGLKVHLTSPDIYEDPILSVSPPEDPVLKWLLAYYNSLPLVISACCLVLAIAFFVMSYAAKEEKE